MAQVCSKESRTVFLIKHLQELLKLPLTTKGRKVHSEVSYPQDGEVYLFFGREDAGLPEELLYRNQDRCVRIPMRKGLRCLNLSNSAAVGVYEVLRQWNYPDLGRQGSLTKYTWDD